MASQTSYHARSNSLPSTSHPIADQLEQNLCRLRSSQATSTSSSSLSHRLSGLSDLYTCIDELLQLPLNQQTLSKNLHEKWVEEVLDGSLRLLDICGTSRDVLLQSKECLQDIQSALHRRCSGEVSISSEVVGYLNTRKGAKKVIKKCFKNIKETNNNEEAIAIVRTLKEVEAITVDIFKSLLSYMAGTKSQSRKSSWSVVAKLIHKEAAAAPTSEFDAVDATLESLICQRKKAGTIMVQGENLKSQIVTLESEIQDLDEVLECLFKHLVKNRANLLNILSN